MSAKQDRQGVRTPAALERKYGGAKSVKDEVSKAVKSIDQNDVFNRLTNNGKAQGMFMGEDGNIYINAEYIVAISQLFANDITMTGTLTNTAEVFLSPGEEEVETIKNHNSGISLIPDSRIPLYDFDNDGVVDGHDYLLAKRAAAGTYSLAEWQGAVKSTVTITIDLTNVNKVIRINGTNMWGREVDTYISADAIHSTFATRKYLDSLVRADGDSLYRIVDGVTEWINPPMEQGVEYRTTERFNGKVVYAKLLYLDSLPANGSVRPYAVAYPVTNLIAAEGLINTSGGAYPFLPTDFIIRFDFSLGNLMLVSNVTVTDGTTAYITVKYTKD